MLRGRRFGPRKGAGERDADTCAAERGCGDARVATASGPWQTCEHPGERRFDKEKRDAAREGVGSRGKHLKSAPQECSVGATSSNTHQPHGQQARSQSGEGGAAVAHLEGRGASHAAPKRRQVRRPQAQPWQGCSNREPSRVERGDLKAAAAAVPAHEAGERGIGRRVGGGGAKPELGLGRLHHSKTQIKQIKPEVTETHSGFMSLNPYTHPS